MTEGALKSRTYTRGRKAEFFPVKFVPTVDEVPKLYQHFVVYRGYTVELEAQWCQDVGLYRIGWHVSDAVLGFIDEIKHVSTDLVWPEIARAESVYAGVLDQMIKASEEAN